jgi:hypothetical protein
MNFSYNLKDLNEYYQAFEQMMEYWTELFSKDIKTINITNSDIPEEMLTLFNQHLDSVLEIENKITIESN